MKLLYALLLLVSVLSSLALVGCGGGGSNLTFDVVLSSSVVATNSSGTTLTPPVPVSGSPAAVMTSKITFNTLYNVDSSTVTIDVQDESGHSITGGAKLMSHNTSTDQYSYSVNIPDNSLHQVRTYTALVLAKDTSGNVVPFVSAIGSVQQLAAP